MRIKVVILLFFLYLAFSYFIGIKAMDGKRACYHVSSDDMRNTCVDVGTDKVAKGFVWIISPFWAPMWFIGDITE